MTPNVFQQVLKAARPNHGRSNDKSQIRIILHDVALHESPHHERQISTETNGSQFNPKRDSLLRQYRKVRRWARIMSAFSNIISGVLSIVIESIMIYVLYKFYSTSVLPMEGRPWGPWARKSVVWPTLMFAAMSIITSFLALAALIALCYRSKRKAVTFSLMFVALHVVAWIVVAIIYRVEKTEQDVSPAQNLRRTHSLVVLGSSRDRSRRLTTKQLWGWSCADKAKAVQRQLGGGKVDFDSLCNIQVSRAFESSRPCLGNSVNLC